MKRITAAAVLIFAFGVGAHVSAQTQIDPEKERDIRHLLELTGAGKLGAQVMENSLSQLRRMFSTLPPETRDKIVREFENEMRKEFTEEKMIEMTITIYDKYLTKEDVKGAVAFYETPVGQKLISVLPQITQEGWQVGAARGEEAGRRAVETLRRQGVIPQPDAAQPAKTNPPPPTKRRRPQR